MQHLLSHMSPDAMLGLAFRDNGFKFNALRHGDLLSTPFP